MKFKRFLIALLLILTTSCGPSPRQEASDDCLFAKEAAVKAAACAYTDSLKEVEVFNTKIEEKEAKIKELQAKIEGLQADIEDLGLDKKAAEEAAELLKKEWEASGKPSTTVEEAPTVAPTTQGGGN